MLGERLTDRAFESAVDSALSRLSDSGKDERGECTYCRVRGLTHPVRKEGDTGARWEPGRPGESVSRGGVWPKTGRPAVLAVASSRSRPTAPHRTQPVHRRKRRGLYPRPGSVRAQSDGGMCRTMK